MSIQTTLDISRADAESKAVDLLDEDAEALRRYKEIVVERLRSGNKSARQALVKMLTNSELESILDEKFYNYNVTG